MSILIEPTHLAKLLLALTLATLAALPQAPPAQVALRDTLRIELPANGPIRHLDTDWGRSRIVQRGSAASAELHLTFHFENVAAQPIHGITLLLRTAGAAAGGRASVTLPGLRVNPGERFPAKVDLRLLQPVTAGNQPAFTLRLDGVLFADLSFAGENSLNSRRLLTTLEMEIQQDRRHLRDLLRAEGKDGLGREMRQLLARQAELPRVDLRWARHGRATAIPASEPVQFAFLPMPSSPLEPLGATVRIAGHEAVAPRLQVRNRSIKEIVYAEIGWIIRDLEGREFYAGTVPATGDHIRLAPGAEALVEQEGVLQFQEQANLSGGARQMPIKLGEMVGYVSQVQFADGSIWMPDLYDSRMPARLRQLRVSPEQQRLASVYLRHGLDALVAELGR
ncbi:MAG: hypothetical protein KIT83_17495 [Bryobacterales bacterium]|nr:hypothetical protein [Bryobacterales bacterium]